jgi:hypothetical protein
VRELLALATTTGLFSYYGNSYAGSTSTAPLSQPVNLGDVTFAQMSLTLLKLDMRNSTSTFVLESGASIRNLKTNLGD